MQFTSFQHTLLFKTYFSISLPLAPQPSRWSPCFTFSISILCYYSFR